MQMIYSPSAVFGKNLENLDFKIVDDASEWFAKGWRTYDEYRYGVAPKAEKQNVEEPAIVEEVAKVEEPKRRGRNRRGV